jgi:hypothetical protein
MEQLYELEAQLYVLTFFLFIFLLQRKQAAIRTTHPSTRQRRRFFLLPQPQPQSRPGEGAFIASFVHVAMAAKMVQSQS